MSASLFLERNVVIPYPVAMRRRIPCARAGRAAAIAGAAQQNHRVRDHLRDPVLHAVLLIAPRLQPALHIDLLPFLEVLRDLLPAPEHDAGPVGLLFPLARALIL